MNTKIRDYVIETAMYLERPERMQQIAQWLASFMGDAHYDTNYKGQGYDRFFIEDGSGYEFTILFNVNGNPSKVLVFSYDTDSSLNTYGADNPEPYVWEAVPEPFKTIVTRGDLFWDWDSNDVKHTYATSALWLEPGDNAWNVSPGYWDKIFGENTDDGGLRAGARFFMGPKTMEDRIQELGDYWLGEQPDLEAARKNYSLYVRD